VGGTGCSHNFNPDAQQVYEVLLKMLDRWMRTTSRDTKDDFSIKRVDDCRDIVRDNSIVSAPITLSQAIGIKRTADLGSGSRSAIKADQLM
jgi:hypothetical protein